MKNLFLIYFSLLLIVGCASSSMNQEEVTEEISQQIQSPKRHWALSFKDKTLIGFLKEARKNNLDIQAASANVEKVVALANQAGAGLKPNLDLGISGNNGNNPNLSNASVTGQLSWELDLWGRLKSGEKAARKSARAAAADLLYARYSIDAAAAKAYFSVIEAQLQEAIAKENLDLNKEASRIVKIKFENGLSQAGDVALAESSLANSQQNFDRVSGAKRIAQRALETILGRYPKAAVETKKDFPENPPPPPRGVPSTLLEDRPDLVAADLRVAAAFDRVKEAKAARLPSLSLTAQGGGASQNLSEALNPANAIWNLGANLLAPVVDGGRRRQQVKVRNAEQKEALAQYKNQALKAFGEVENSLDQDYVLNKRLTQLEVSVNEAKKAYEVMKLRFDAGDVELLDVLNIQQKVITAKSTQVSV